MIHEVLLQNTQCEAIIIRGTDMHGVEIPHPLFMIRHALSGFYGSAGTLVVHKNGAVGLWTDSRYEIAAQDICTARAWDLFIHSEHAWESQVKWISQKSYTNAQSHTASIALCELQHSHREYTELASCAKKSGYTLKNIPHATLHTRALHFLQQPYDERGVSTLSNTNIVTNSTKIWHVHEKKIPYKVQEKLCVMENYIHTMHAHCFISANIHEIAYLTGLRGQIMPHLMLCPCVLAIIHNATSQKMCYVFMLPHKLCNASFTQKLHTYLNVPIETIQCIPYENLMKETIDVSHFTKFFAEYIDPIILYDPDHVPSALVHALQSDAIIRKCGGILHARESPLKYVKDVRSDGEIALIRESVLVDCTALLEALCEVVEKLSEGEILYEKSIAEIVQKHRKAQRGFLEESFQTISAAGENGALPHYAITDTKGSRIQSDEPYLLDCGAHYACETHAGTTDITRSFLFSKLISCATHNAHTENNEKIHAYKEDYTAVLKAHIALATSVFPSATRGKDLHENVRDVLKKQNNRTYEHGTGHGVGFCTDVHEGICGISARGLCEDCFKPNMVLSNEPGYYVKNVWGIRLENVMRVREGESSDSLQFETLTFFPFQQNLVIESKLTELEKTWFCNYQDACKNMLEHRVSKGARALLERLTS